MYHLQTFPAAGLYLEGIAVSVGYGDFLDTTLQKNLDHFDNFVVVTSYDDTLTQSVCARHGVTCVQTDHHRDDGAAFNKGLLINLGLAHLRHRGWIVHLDADIALPDRIRWMLSKSRLDADCSYGADRLEVIGRPMWRRLQTHGRFLRQYRYKYLVGGPPLPLGTPAAAQRIRLLPHRLLPAFGIPSTPGGGITTARARPSTATCSSPCNGRPASGCSCRACSSITCNRRPPRSARTGRGGKQSAGNGDELSTER